METLIELLKKCLAESFAMYLKAHNFHWNVEGKNFKEFHDFFGNVYEEIFESIDPFAEQIRALDSYVPGSFKRFTELSSIKDELSFPSDIDMCKKLLEDNKTILESLDLAFKLADKFEKQGLADFVSGRIDYHEKLGWMLRSFVKSK